MGDTTGAYTWKTHCLVAVVTFFGILSAGPVSHLIAFCWDLPGILVHWSVAWSDFLISSNNFQHVKTSQSHGNETDIQVRDPFIYLVLSCFPRQSAPLILEHLLSILMLSAVPQNPCPRLLRKVSKLFWNISTSKDCAPERRCEAWKRQQETNRNRDFHEVTGLKGKQKQHK